jgi:O-antigen/teichoic acid export membrane protein
MFIAAAIAIPINFCLIGSARFVIRLWIGPAVLPSLLLLVGLGVWSVFTAVSGSLASFLNGVGFIKVQAICGVFMALTNIGMSIYLTRHIGISGVVYGSILSQLCCIFIPYGLLLPRLLARVERQFYDMPLAAPRIDAVASTVQV